MHAGALTAITDVVVTLFDGRVIVEAAKPTLSLDMLFPAERRHIASWAHARQADFAAARVCARRALGRLGLEPGALVPYEDRSPRWPDGAVGSITHTGDLCVVAVARAADVAGVGLDIEATSLPVNDIEDLVCTPAERHWLDGHAMGERGRYLKLLFSAKEAFYKCQYPMTKAFLDFQDVELTVDLAAGAFASRIVESEHARLNDLAQAVSGRWAWVDDRVITAASLSRGPDDRGQR